jgi:hypothetical protein
MAAPNGCAAPALYPLLHRTGLTEDRNFAEN